MLTKSLHTAIYIDHEVEFKLSGRVKERRKGKS